MNFKELEIENFLTIGKAKIELDERGLLLIQGVNGDDPSAESNGAGKSSIVDALCWALYGVTARGVKGDAVVNKTAKKNCDVRVTIIDGADHYLIARHRKHATHKNALHVTKVTPGALAVDMSKGTDDETQKVVESIIGCSLDVFMAAVYAGQERMPDLPGMTDKVLKTLIEEAAGVEVLTAAYSIASKRLNTAKTTFESLKASLVAAQNTESHMAGEVLRLKETVQGFEDGRKDRARTELAEAGKVASQQKIVEATLAGIDTAGAQGVVDRAKVTLGSHNDEVKKLTELRRLAMVAQRDADANKSATVAGAKVLKEATQALADIDSVVGKPCGECGKTYCEHDLDDARAVRQAAIQKQKDLLRPLVAKQATLDATLKAAQEAATEFEDQMPDVSEVAAFARTAQEALNQADRHRLVIKQCEAQIESIKAAAKTKLTEPNPYVAMVDKAIKDHEKAIEHKVNLTDKTQEANAAVLMLEDAVKVFGPAGVRAHVLDTVTPYLNERTQEYLGALADGNIHAEWSTLGKTAKGELREKFNIDVMNDKGAESFAGLSGGEKRKVRLATAMALQDMVASRATKPINIFIADEVDHALDESGLERLMGVLERKARERGTVLVISHNSLSDWIDNVITVTKSGGLATAAGATEHGHF